MSHWPRRIVPLLLLAAASISPVTALANTPATQPDVDKYDALVRQLGDPDPAVRKSAYDALAAAHEAAYPALRKAMRSKRPAIADAARMLKAAWFSADDPIPVQNRLAQYGALPDDGKATVLQSLATSRDPAFHKAALRVSQQEPSDNVIWAAFGSIALDDSWQPFLTDPAAGPIPSAVLIARARGMIRLKRVRGPQIGATAVIDPLTPDAVKLLDQAIDQERAHPSGSATDLAWAVNVLVDHDLVINRPASAAVRLRMLVGRGDTQPQPVDADNTDAPPPPTSTAISQRLLELQARYGPLPGLDRDLAAADEPTAQATLTIIAIAQRLGDPLTARVLLDAVLVPLPREADTDRATRLFGVADSLIRVGMNAAAENVLDRVVAIDAPGLDTITNAYCRLHDLHQAAGEEQLAGDCLQRAQDHLGPGDSLRVRRANGVYEAWPKEEVRGHIAWLYFTAAKKRDDTPEMNKQANAVMTSGTTDSEVFLDVLPALEGKNPPGADAIGTQKAPAKPAADKEAVDAFFDRVYAKSADRLAAAPGDPLWMNDMAWLCSRSARHLNEAVKLAIAAVAARPDEAAYLDTLADAKFQTGAPAEALALELRAAALLPENTFMREQVDRFRKAAATPTTKP